MFFVFVLVEVLGCCAVAASPFVTTGVDWSTFLAQHDLTWGWEWGAGGAYTLQPVASELDSCGPKGAKGACCFQSLPGTHAISLAGCNPSLPAQQWRLEANGSVINAASNECMSIVSSVQDYQDPDYPPSGKTLTSQDSGAADLQIGLVNEKSWTCSKTAIPPGECCLPVPGQKISGCHAATEQRWKYNQFFEIEMIRYVANSAEAGGASARALALSASSLAASFLLRTKEDTTQCMSATNASMHAAACNPQDPNQQWAIMDINNSGPGNSRIASVGTGQCIAAPNPGEATSAVLAPCTPSTADNMWKPLCAPNSAQLVPGWGCFDRGNMPPPSPSPSPAPSPHPHPQPPSPPTATIIGTQPCSIANTLGWAQYEGFWMAIKPPKKASASSSSSSSSNTGAPASPPSDSSPKAYRRWHDRHHNSRSSKHSRDAGGGGDNDGPNPDGTCLKMAIPSFCDGTVCPYSLANNFKNGTTFSIAGCTNGDRSQLFAAYTIPTATAPAQQTLIPLTWAVSAYVGNGLVGVRVQSEEGGVGVLHVLLDNVMLGALSKRKPTGYFRMTVADPSGGPYKVSLRQHIATSTLNGNVTDEVTGKLVSSFSVFVNADLKLPAVVLKQMTPPGTPLMPAMEWVLVGSPDFHWQNTSDVAAGMRTVLASVQDSNARLSAAAVVAKALSSDLDAVYAAHCSWWSAYWAQSFVTLPVTRLESFYFVEMYRFAASDRVVLQGLMGAFGPTDNYNLWPDDVWDMNEQVMYWIGAASNRPQITNPMEAWVEGGGSDGGPWMLHNYVKQVTFEGNNTKLSTFAWPAVVKDMISIAGTSESAPGSLKLINGTYHLVGCSSPEYKCYPPFQNRMCSTKQDCNYELSQLRWGLETALKLTSQFNLGSKLKAKGVDIAWWQDLMAGKLAWYPYDDVTGFRLDAECAFECPHRHFSHLLQIYDLETVQYDESKATGNASLNRIMLNGLDNWYRVTCNESNWFNEECRGFTQCGMASMSAVMNRPEAAQGNLTSLIDNVVTPNGMYGEMVYQSHPNEFSPVSESAYCGAGVIHTMLMHTNTETGVLSLFPGFSSSWTSGGFFELRASQGLLVSASRQNSTTLFVGIQSVSAQNITVAFPGDAAWSRSTPPSVLPAAGGVAVVAGPSAGTWTVMMPAGPPGVVLFLDPAAKPPFVVNPLPSNKTQENFFGYNRPMQPLH